MKRNLLLGGIAVGITAIVVGTLIVMGRGGQDKNFGDEMLAREERSLGLDRNTGGLKAAPPPAGVNDAATAREATGKASPSGGTGTAPESTLLERKIVQNATLSLQVKDPGGAFQDVGQIAVSHGGFVASSTFTSRDKDQLASVTIRVPTAEYQSVLNELRKLSVKVEGENSAARDVTEEYSDLQAQLRNLQATEARYLEFMKQAKSVDEVLKLQDRLDSVRLSIERVQGRINLLDHLSDLATITVHLNPVPAIDHGQAAGIDPLRAAAHAWETSLEVLRGVASTAIVGAIIVAWLLVPLAVIVLAARYWLRRRGVAQAID